MTKEEMKLSKYQEAVLEEVRTGSGNIIVSSVPGGGKTTMLELIAFELKRLEKGQRKRYLFAAFNKHIAMELQDRLEGTDFKVKTIHALGWAACNQNLPNMKVEKGKLKRFVKDEIRAALASKTRLSDEHKNALSNYKSFAFDIGNIYELLRLQRRLERKGIVEDALFYRLEDVSLVPFAQDLLKKMDDENRNLALQRGIISYCDMVCLPLELGFDVNKYDWILVDEVQDLSAAQVELLLKSASNRARFVAVGDKCQPEGTMVTVPADNSGLRGDDGRFAGGIPAKVKEVPIETLSKGDLVVSADMRSSSFIQGGKEVLGISSRPYEGNMVVVESNGKKSRYTPNHRCVVRFSGLRNQWCVYVQRNHDGQYRIGKSKMNYVSNGGQMSGPIARARAEGAEAMWILSTYEREIDAIVSEESLGGRFGISQLRFNDNYGSSVLTQEVLNETWRRIGCNGDRAKALLYEYGKDYRYPLWDHTKDYFSLKRPIVTMASNLIDGVEFLHYEGKAHYKASQWAQAKVSVEWFEGNVYSMDVDKYELYVADGLLTHNCQAIYAFAGAGKHSFRDVRRATSAKELPLSICYRCPTSHVENAAKIYKGIEAREDAPGGDIIHTKDQSILLEAQAGDLVLCRVTAPLVKTALFMLKNRVPAKIRGKDIGDGITVLLKRIYGGPKIGPWTEINIDEFEERTNEFLKHEQSKFVDPDRWLERLESYKDQISAIKTIMSFGDVETIEDFEEIVDSIFGDENSVVWLSTVHRAKGLEANNVFIVNPDSLQRVDVPESHGSKQERNLHYVAVTRAKKRLVIVYDEGSKLPRPPNIIDGKEI